MGNVFRKCTEPQDNDLNEEEPATARTQLAKKRVKVLLLGAGEAGKSTLARQIKIFHMKGFTESELQQYKVVVHRNVLKNMKTLVKGAESRSIQIQNEDLAKRVMSNEEDSDTFVLTPEIAAEIKTLWTTDAGIMEAYKCGGEFHLVESASYYFDCLDRISHPNYIPTNDDILRSRRLTVSAEEFEFEFDGYEFHVIDVGGQKGEREKWIYYFQNNDAVIFFAALSEYDQKLYEDDTTNRMHESLKVFTDVSNHLWFANTAVILFLNKSDIFREKIKHVPISVAFPDYAGSNTFEETSEFIKNKFIERVQNQKPIYPFITCATNTENFKSLFSAIKDIIITKQQEEHRNQMRGQ